MMMRQRHKLIYKTLLQIITEVVQVSKHTTTLMEIIQGELQREGFNEMINDGNLTINDPSFAFIQKVLHFDDDVKKIVDDKIFKSFRFNDERIDRYFKEAFTTRFLDREIGRQTVEAFASLVLYETIIREDYIFTVFGDELYKYLENHVDYKGEVIGNTIEDETQNHINEEIQNQTSEEKTDNTSNETYKEDTTSKGTNVSDSREATSTLPQSEMNMNVDNDVLTFADDNTITKNKTTTTDKSNTTGERDTKGNTITNGKQNTTTNDTNDTTSKSNQDTTSNQKTYSKTYLMENLEKLYATRERIFNDYDRKCFLHIW